MAVVARETGATGEPEDMPPLMPEAAYLWTWYIELDHARGGSGFGVNPLSFSELAAWSGVTDTPLEPWEVRAIRAIDRKYLIARAAQA